MSIFLPNSALLVFPLCPNQKWTKIGPKLPNLALLFFFHYAHGMVTGTKNFIALPGIPGGPLSPYFTQTCISLE
jgi:hypothetical protein